MAIDFLGKRTVFLVVIVVSVVFATIAMLYVYENTRRYVSPEDAAERHDLRYVLLCVSLLEDSLLGELAKPGENVNSPAFAALCASRLREYYPPLRSFSIETKVLLILTEIWFMLPTLMTVFYFTQKTLRI